MMNPQYRIVEIFETLQGEGFNTGMPSIFIRFGKCNLACAWCDTNYHQFDSTSLNDILAKVQSFNAKNIVITGGEPTIQANIGVLLSKLKSLGYYLAIESNGLMPIPSEIDYISISPKACYAEKYVHQHVSHADEIRVVVDGDVRSFCAWLEQHITAKRYYLSPLDTNGSSNLLQTITQIGQLNERGIKTHWQLSLQTHKMVGIE